MMDNYLGLNYSNIVAIVSEPKYKKEEPHVLLINIYINGENKLILNFQFMRLNFVDAQNR